MMDKEIFKKLVESEERSIITVVEDLIVESSKLLEERKQLHEFVCEFISAASSTNYVNAATARVIEKVRIWNESRSKL